MGVTSKHSTRISIQLLQIMGIFLFQTATVFRSWKCNRLWDLKSNWKELATKNQSHPPATTFAFVNFIPFPKLSQHNIDWYGAYTTHNVSHGPVQVGKILWYLQFYKAAQTQTEKRLREKRINRTIRKNIIIFRIEYQLFLGYVLSKEHWKAA